ncbi:MAG: hypothetical protein KAI63_08695, partial [Planctomycetes bacterium]|nr:hypothetical protein [Planctomycetota bacterium]
MKNKPTKHKSFSEIMLQQKFDRVKPSPAGEKALKELETRYKETQDQLVKLQTSNKDLRQALNAVRQKCFKKLKDIENQQTELLKARLNGQESMMEEIKQALYENLPVSLSQKETDLAAEQQLLGNLQQNNIQLLQELAEKENGKKRLTDRIHALEQDIKQKNQDRKTLSHQISGLQPEVAGRQTRLEQLNAHIQKLETEAAEKNARLQELEQVGPTSDTKLQELQDQYNFLDAELSQKTTIQKELKEKLPTLIASVKDKEGSLAQLNQQIDQVMKKNAIRSDLLKELSAETETMANQVNLTN